MPVEDLVSAVTLFDPGFSPPCFFLGAEIALKVEAEDKEGVVFISGPLRVFKAKEMKLSRELLGNHF